MRRFASVSVMAWSSRATRGLRVGCSLAAPRRFSPASSRPRSSGDPPAVAVHLEPAGERRVEEEVAHAPHRFGVRGQIARPGASAAGTQRVPSCSCETRASRSGPDRAAKIALTTTPSTPSS